MAKLSQNRVGQESQPEKRRPGNPRSYPERKLLRLQEGALARVEAVCEPGEDAAEFIRAAIEREIERRMK